MAADDAPGVSLSCFCLLVASLAPLAPPAPVLLRQRAPRARRLASAARIWSSAPRGSFSPRSLYPTRRMAVNKGKDAPRSSSCRWPPGRSGPCPESTRIHVPLTPSAIHTLPTCCPHFSLSPARSLSFPVCLSASLLACQAGCLRLAQAADEPLLRRLHSFLDPLSVCFQISVSRPVSSPTPRSTFATVKPHLDGFGQLLHVLDRLEHTCPMLRLHQRRAELSAE